MLQGRAPPSFRAGVPRVKGVTPSHGPAEHWSSCGSLLGKIRVKRHGDVAEKPAPQRGHLISVPGGRDQPVLDQRLQTGSALIRRGWKHAKWQIEVAHQPENGESAG